MLPGLNMQYPYSRMLFGGLGHHKKLPRKYIETRKWRLSEAKLNTPIVIIETPGPKKGVEKAQMIGVVTFSDIKEYTNEEAWRRDLLKHHAKFDLQGQPL